MSKLPPMPDLEAAVRDRYASAAREREGALCCPTSYDPRLLAALPREVIERDYGCGDPTKHLRPGETVLDLGSGTGKVCFLAAQVVGAAGKVIGVDMNDDMLAVARRAAPEVASTIGYANVEFRKGKIQDLAIDRDRVDAWLQAHPVRCEADLVELEARLAELRAQPMIGDATIDVVVSNCVLNLVRPEDKAAMFRELHRVLARGGRAVISDIVSDEDVPPHLQADPTLWSGCISGAFREDRFLAAFEDAGFYGIEILERQAEPWQTVEGIELRSLTVVAYKGKEGPCLERHQSVIYRGPWREVQDDDGHVLRRGVRTAVCDKTFQIFSRAPYREHVDLIEPVDLVPLEQAEPFVCETPRVREARHGKGAMISSTDRKPGCC